MLETVRAYAAERLAASADAEPVREDHFRYYLALAERHGTAQALRGARAETHFATLDAEIDNLHAAIGWAVATRSAGRALAMAAALDSYWLLRNRYADALHWVEQALNLPDAEAEAALQVHVLCAKARCLWRVGRGAEQPAVLAVAEAIARRLDDPLLVTKVIQCRVHHDIDAGRLERGDALADEALHWAHVARDDWEIAEAFRAKAIAAPGLTELRERVDDAAALLMTVGNLDGLASLLTSAAYSALCLGNGQDASDYAARAISPTRALGNPYAQMMNCGNLGLAALLTGAPGTAAQAFHEELRLCRAMVVLPVAYEGLRGLAAVAASSGDDPRAATLVGASDAHRYDWPGDPLEARLDAEFFQPARARYGTDAWNERARRGGALNFLEAIAYGLSEG